MILLDGHSLNRKIQFRPESQSLTLEERRGQSALTLGDGAPEIQVGDWLLDDTAPGAGIVWRAKTADMNFFRETGTRTIQLEHIVNTLRDGVIFDELKWDSISASSAIRHILGLTGGLWTLGDFEPQDVSWPYKFNACTWMDALETITRTLEDAWWDYDLSSLPFRLHIRSLNGETDSEMRMSRNITGIRRSVDRSRMYTRFYPIGLNDLHITGDYLSRNEDVYGTCCKIETNQAIDNEAELRSWAEDRLKRHCEPIVTVTVSGLDLSRDTGEPLDALRLNRVCRVPLPEFGTTIREKVSRLQWPDKIKSQDKMNVVLANEKEDIASIFNQQAAGSEASRSGGGRGAKKKIEEDHAWFVDTSDHVAMVAEAIIGQGPDGVDWSRVAALSVDGYGIHGRVTRAEGYLVTMTGRMDMDEERLTVAFETIGSVRSEMELTAESLRVSFENEAASLRSEFSMTAESLRVAFANDVASVRSELTVTAESLRSSFSNDISSVRSSISQQADRISLVVEGTGTGAAVKRAAIQAAIVNSNGKLESSIKITADNIDIDGDTFAEYLQSTDIICDTVTCDSVDVVTGNYTNVYIESGGDITVGGNSIANPIMSVTDPGYSGNSKTVTFTHADGTEETVTFSRAITSNTWSWSGGSAKVVLQPQNQTFYSPAIDAIQQNGSATWDADKKGFSVNIDVDDSQGTTVFSDSLHFGALNAWNDGHAKGSPSSGTAGGRTSGVTALVHDFTITSADGTTKTIQIDCTSIYSTARSGYSPGTYTPVTRTAVKTSVTRAHTGTLIANGHYEYLRGGAISGYKRGSSGPKIKRWGSGTLYPNPNGTGGMNKEWFYSDSGGTQYYESGGSYSGYADGGSAWVYDAGDAITYYLSNEMESVTLYSKD